MKKSTIILIILSLLTCCTKESYKYNTKQQTVGVILKSFDEITQRYVIPGEIAETRSPYFEQSVESLTWENHWLDSMATDAERNGIYQTVIYLNKRQTYMGTLFSDDSLNFDEGGIPIDSIAFEPYTECGTLHHDQSSIVELELAPDYLVDISGFCDRTINHNGLIFTLQYTTCHNLVISTNNRRIIYTADYDPRFDTLPVYMSGEALQEDFNVIELYYCNSDNLNRDSIIWTCNYCIYAYVPETD